MARRRYKKRTKRRYHKKRNVNKKVYTYYRSCDSVFDNVSGAVVSNLVGSAAGVTNYAFLFRLSDLPNVTEFTSLYDQYMIKSVKLHFVNEQTMTSLGAAQTTTPYFYVVRDFDDAATLSTVNAALQYQDVRMVPFYRSHTMTVKPQIALAAYSGAFSSYSAANPWIDCNSPSVEYYGVKLIIQQNIANNIGGWRLWATYKIAFRRVR